MKKDYFIVELFKSGPFILLMVMILSIVLGIFFSNRHKRIEAVKENMISVSPVQKK